jgi:hypothetical protein
MLEARNLGDLVSTISLKRSTQNLQLSTSWAGRLPHLLDQSGQKWILGRDGLSAFDPTATSAVHRGNGFDEGFSPYQSTRLSR